MTHAEYVPLLRPSREEPLFILTMPNCDYAVTFTRTGDSTCSCGAPACAHRDAMLAAYNITDLFDNIDL